MPKFLNRFLYYETMKTARAKKDFVIKESEDTYE